MQQVLQRFLRDSSGATAIEYGLIACGIAAAIVAAVQTLGTSINTTLYGSVNTAMSG